MERFASTFSLIICLCTLLSYVTKVQSQSSTSLALQSNETCDGPCTFYYLSTGYAWKDVTSTTTITLSEGEEPPATTEPPVLPDPNETWVITIGTTSSGQMGFSGAGQPNYTAFPFVEYTTTFTLTRSNGDVQRYDGFFTVTHPSDPASTGSTCRNTKGSTALCCNPGYTTNFDYSFTGVLVTNGPTDYFPNIPGLNTEGCITTKLGGIPFTKQGAIMLTEYHTLDKNAASSTGVTGMPSSTETASTMETTISSSSSSSYPVLSMPTTTATEVAVLSVPGAGGSSGTIVTSAYVQTIYSYSTISVSSTAAGSNATVPAPLPLPSGTQTSGSSRRLEIYRLIGSGAAVIASLLFILYL